MSSLRRLCGVPGGSDSEGRSSPGSCRNLHSRTWSPVTTTSVVVVVGFFGVSN